MGSVKERKSPVNAVLDQFDFQDRLLQPELPHVPTARLDLLGTLASWFGTSVPALSQGSTNAFTGFALPSVVNYLRRYSGLKSGAEAFARMLYSPARRYDQFLGSSRAASDSWPAPSDS